ncbi:MAG: ubiquinone biosynthesis protein UbiA [Niastella sp. SCN 39-18]|nr:geranylgeranylglycerol-phosphate geranylgeranyltransferase [Sphingobacteriales bacterium]ODT52034.1 MAG: ubiquinone biosynthesis protein UbiA [Niastella sp. SCN 39-18]OJW10994.1 MAG: ubiquinone biosynthesis protein UbiA [Sphingobacteriales bacterium 39-19]
MRLIAAFLRLIRWPNLFFIILTQSLFYFCVFKPMLKYPLPASFDVLFWILVTASVCIAAAGYIINDYFDFHIDAINKPQKVVIDNVIKRRWAIIWHWFLSGLGILLTAYISYKTNKFHILAANITCVLLLWFYSTTFKKKILWGNILISLLTAWVILVIYFFVGTGIGKWQSPDLALDVKRLYKFAILYAGFAFLLSVIREAVKDLEDLEGDIKYGCRTMPIVWGVPAAKVYTAIWLVVCVGMLTAILIYAGLSGWWVASLYIAIAILIPLFMILFALGKAGAPEAYHKISSMLKLVMLAGILSMLFFLILK